MHLQCKKCLLCYRWTNTVIRLFRHNILVLWVMTPYFLGRITNLPEEYAAFFYSFDKTPKLYAAFSFEMIVPTPGTTSTELRTLVFMETLYWMLCCAQLEGYKGKAETPVTFENFNRILWYASLIVLVTKIVFCKVQFSVTRVHTHTHTKVSTHERSRTSRLL